MTIIQTSPQLRLDGLVVATLAHGLETTDGLDGTAGRRTRQNVQAYAPGALEEWGDFPGPRTRTFNIWIIPNDADGAVTYTNGPMAHLRANIDQLEAILAKRRTPINVELDVTTPTGAVETRQGYAKTIGATAVRGTRKRIARVPLVFPFPYWNVQPKISTAALNAAGSPYALAVGGGAPVHDITLTFSDDARLTHDDTGDYIEVTGSGATPVVVSLRPPVTITQSGAAARNLVRRNRPWWMYWTPGTVNLTVTGTGTVQIDYYESRE